MRKYPPVVALDRKSLREYTFADLKVTIPAGTKIFIPVYSIQHDEKYYPNPENFDPERFDPEVEKTRHSMTFLAFGSGPRNCIG